MLTLLVYFVLLLARVRAYISIEMSGGKWNYLIHIDSFKVSFVKSGGNA